MWTSEREAARHALRARALEALGLAVPLGLLPELAASRHGSVLEPHPGWIAVLVLAARHGGGGFFAGLAATAVAVGIGSALAGAGFLPPWIRRDPAPNLVALGACLAVSWVGSWHLRLRARLSERHRALTERAAEADATIQSLYGAVATLRARADRTATSLSFLRDVAARLEGTDPVAAAEGAADLALARSGAGAAAVKASLDGSLRLLAVKDARGSRRLAPLVSEEADLTVPVRNGDAWMGVIALWGIDRSTLDEATAHDLGVIASWLAQALGSSGRRAEPSTRPSVSLR